MNPSDILARLILDITVEGIRLAGLIKLSHNQCPHNRSKKPTNQHTWCCCHHTHTIIIIKIRLSDEVALGKCSLSLPNSSRYQSSHYAGMGRNNEKLWISREIQRKKNSNQGRVRNKVNVGKEKTFVWSESSIYWQNVPGEKSTTFGEWTLLYHRWAHDLIVNQGRGPSPLQVHAWPVYISKGWGNF